MMSYQRFPTQLNAKHVVVVYAASNLTPYLPSTQLTAGLQLPPRPACLPACLLAVTGMITGAHKERAPSQEPILLLLIDWADWKLEEMRG